MANAAALVKESIWRDRDFRGLPRSAQCTYLQLVSQKDLDCAGMLTLHISFLAKGCDDITEDDVRADLAVLQGRRFVFFDEEADELFIRGYMRTAQVVKSPNIFKSALKSARMVTAPQLRAEVAAELRRLHRKEATELAEELNPSGTLRPDPTNPSRSETLPEPSSTGTVSVLGSPSLVDPVGEEPSPFCPDHPNDTDRGCFACRSARRSYPERKAAWDAAVLEAARIRRENCTRCHGTSTYEDADGVHKCDPHVTEAAHA